MNFQIFLFILIVLPSLFCQGGGGDSGSSSNGDFGTDIGDNTGPTCIEECSSDLACIENCK
jgi:hypothetical protein